MKVLILTAAYPPASGGVATHVADLAHGLMQKGHEIFVVTVNKDELPRKDGHGRLTIWKRPRRQVLDFDGRRVFCEDTLKFLLSHWHKIDPDIVHVHDLDSLYLAWLAKCAFGKPIVMTVHRAPSPWRHQRYKEIPKDTFLEAARAARVLDGIVVPSEASRAVLKDQGFGAGEGTVEIKVIPHGISQFLYGVADDLEVAALLHASANRALVFCPSRADEHKDVDTFLEAAARLKKLDQDSSLLFLIGSDPSDGYHAKLQSRAQQLGLREGEELVFRKFEYKEMATVYRRARLCVVPSRHESFGLTVLEAFMFGLPVVAANTTALKEIVTNGKNGLLFTDGDADDLASQMLRILSDPGLKERLSLEGKKTLAEGQRYSVITMIEEYERFYTRLVTA